MNLLEGKKGLIIGLSNNMSIAWGITKQCAINGASLAIAYQNEAMKKRAEPLSAEVNAEITCQCDCLKDEEVDAMVKMNEEKWGKLDFVVHSIAYAPKEDLKGEYHNISQNGFDMAMNISAYSLIKFTSKLAPLMKDGGSILTLTYYGGEKVVPNYKLMGTCKAALDSVVRELSVDLGEKNIRINAISAGPIRTLAASGISDFVNLTKAFEAKAPLHRLVTTEEVGNSAVYLLSNMSSAVTGEVHHVDCGYNITA